MKPRILVLLITILTLLIAPRITELAFTDPQFDTVRTKAEQGDAEAQYQLGKMYDDGKGVTQNDIEAIKWYRKAADQGLANAQDSLGVMYHTGQGVVQDYAEAAIWYRKAADKNHAKAQYNLGIM